jgi:hypothetical protein
MTIARIISIGIVVMFASAVGTAAFGGNTLKGGGGPVYIPAGEDGGTSGNIPKPRSSPPKADSGGTSSGGTSGGSNSVSSGGGGHK